MSSATLELYNALVEAGVDKEKAEAAAKAVISREEAKTFTTKSDLIELRSQLIWMVGLHIASLGVIIALFA
jgi:hypothetical protein